MQLAAGRTTLDAEKRNVADLSLREAVRLLSSEPDDADDDDADDEPRKKSQQLGGSGDDEYFTPRNYVEAVRDVLGTIDLDPASCPSAQATVKATRYFTKDDDGLAQAWNGRVFLNPPFSRSLLKPFGQKLIAEFRAGRVTEAILLTFSNTSTSWFQEAAAVASAICFTDHNIRFFHRDKGEMGRSAIGQAFLYFGRDVGKFALRFESIGTVVTPYKPRTAHAEIPRISASELIMILRKENCWQRVSGGSGCV